MNSDDLTREQAYALYQRISPMLTYLVEVEKRMAKQKFPPDDELRVLFGKARSAIYDLRQAIHQRSSSGNMRRKIK